MTIPKINNPGAGSLKILVAPLDWGLGHATRCIPIIKELLNLKCEVFIAASGDQKALLELEFPALPFVELPGYGIKYGKNRAFTVLKIITLIPKILIRIKREKAWFRRFIVQERPDAVISDNRYGLHSREVFSVFMTHQLNIKTPFGKISDRLLQMINYRAIGRFSICWIPDWAIDTKDGSSKKIPLAGLLSHPEKLPVIPLRYIGVLSRFEKISGNGSFENVGRPENCDLLILLSGPEPQRTILERMIVGQLPGFNGKTVLVRGLPGGLSGLQGERSPWSLSPLSASNPLLTVYEHLPAGLLNRVIFGAALVISRPGYSSVMDLLKLGKKCIFVPTPGQTEQEYLGGYLFEKRLALSLLQSGFSLMAALSMAAQFDFANVQPDGREEDSTLHMAMEEFVAVLAKGSLSRGWRPRVDQDSRLG
jgi:predicted glycosyltransferase